MPSIPQIKIGNNTYDLKDKRVDNLNSALNYPSLHALNEYFTPMTNYIRYFAIYGDLSAYTKAQLDAFTLRIVGYYTDENRFYVSFYDGTTLQSLICDYDSKPTSGYEWLRLYESPQSSANIMVEILVDWSAYDDSYYIQKGQAQGIPLTMLDRVLLKDAVFTGDNTLLNTVPKGKILTGTFVATKAYILSDGEQLIGRNATIKVGSGAQISFGNNCIIDGITFVGDWEPERTTQGDHYAPLITADALKTGDTNAIYGQGMNYDYGVIYGYSASARHNSKIRNCYFKNFARPCIVVEGGNHRDDAGFEISNNTFTDCWNAICIRSQFAKVHDNTYFRCIVGLIVNAGNLCKVGEVFKGCDCSIYYPANVGNGGHGEAVGLEIAHSGIAGIYAAEIPYPGDIYTGCQIVDAPVIADNSNYLLITAGKLDTFVKIASGRNNAIMGNIVSVDYIGSNPLYDVPSNSFIKNNVPMRNATEAQVNNQSV